MMQPTPEFRRTGGQAEPHEAGGEAEDAEPSKFPPNDRQILDESWFEMYDTRENF